MTAFVLTEHYLAHLKRNLRSKFPDIKSSHLSEALAAALGMRTHAALIEHLDKINLSDPPVLGISEDAFLVRLQSLCPTFSYKAKKESLFPMPAFRGYGSLIRTHYKRWQSTVDYKTPRAKAWRNLMVAAINAGIEQELFSIRNGDNRWPGADQGKAFVYRFMIKGTPAFGYVEDVGFGMLKVHAAPYTMLGVEKRIHITTAGFDAAHVFGMACMERDDGAYLRTDIAFFRARQGLLPLLAKLNIKTKGYSDKGKIAM